MKWINLFFILFLLINITASAQEIIWYEDFDDLPNGTTVDNGATKWTTHKGNPDNYNGDHYFEVRDGEFQAYKLHLQSKQKSSVYAQWLSEAINISGKSHIFVFVEGFSMLAEGNNVNFDPEDFVQFEYKLNGGPLTPCSISGIETSNGKVSQDFVIAIASSGCSTNGITGNTLQISIKFSNSGSSETYAVDNIKVISDPFRPNPADYNYVANVSGDWDSPATWGKSTVPGPNDDVLIECGTLVELKNSSNNAKNVTINSGGALIFAANDARLTIAQDGDLLIRDGGLFRIGGAREVASYTNTRLSMSGNASITNNSAFNQVGRLTITGSSSHIQLDGNGAFEMDEIFFDAADQTFINKSHLVLNSQTNQKNGSFTFNFINDANSILEFNGQDLNTTRLKLYANAENNKVLYNRASNQNIYKPELGYYHLVIANSGTKDTKNNSFGNSTLDINGDLIIVDAARLDVENNNSITLGGNFIVTSTNGNPFNERSGTVIIDGISDQQLGTSLGTETFHKLTIDKPTGNVVLTSPITINNQLTLTSGIIRSTSTNILNFGNSSSCTGASNQSHVSGPVRKTGNNAFTFPIGKDEIYAPLAISGMTNGSSTTQFTAEYFNEAAPNPDNKESGFKHVSSMEYWDLSRTFDDGNDAACFVELFFLDKDHSKITAQSDLIVVHYNSQTSKWENMGATFPTANSVKSNVLLSSFSPFAFGSLNGANALPVEYISFIGENIEGGNLLKWSTSSERENEYFIVEKSRNGLDWVECGKVSGNGTTTLVHSYDFLDKNPFFGVGYYRLKQVDYNGSFKYSFVISINNSEIPDFTLDKIFPNPSIGKINVAFLTPFDKTTTIAIRNLQGQVVYQHEYLSEVGYNEFDLDIEHLSKGIYFIVLQQGQKQIAEKIIKK